MVATHDVDWGTFYVIAVTSWGIAPSEFWAMSPAEWWLIQDSKRERDPEIDYAGSLSDADCDDMYKMLKG